MAAFLYRSADSNGKVVSGRLEANTSDEAAAQLRSRGLEPLRIERQAQRSAKTRLRARRRAGLFVRALALLLNAGHTLEHALQALAAHGDNRLVAEAARDLLPAIRAGLSPSDAFSRRPDLFPAHYATAAEAGQISGRLGQALADLATDEERHAKIRDEVRGALIYPAILAVASIAAICFLLIVVAPNFETMFTNLNTSPPPGVAGLFAASRLLREQGFLIFAGLCLLAALIYAGFNTHSMRTAFDRRILQAPFIGATARAALAARFFRTLELLLRSGLSAAPALGAARKTVDNSWARAQLDTAFQNVRTGRSAAREIAQLGILPPLSNALLMAAEDAGALKEGAERLAILYEEELDRRIKILMRIAEPVFVGLTGLAVGTIMLTLVSALISVNEAIAQ